MYSNAQVHSTVVEADTNLQRAFLQAGQQFRRLGSVNACMNPGGGAAVPLQALTPQPVAGRQGHAPLAARVYGLYAIPSFLCLRGILSSLCACGKLAQLPA